MDTQIWKSPSTDLSVCFADKKYDEIESYVNDNVQNLIYEWLQMKYEDLHHSLTYGRIVVNFFIASLGKDSRNLSLIKAGSLLGTIGSLEKLLNDVSENNRFENDEAFRVKHLKDVILVLETHGSMTHTELCASLDLKASTLSEAMKKILPTGLIIVSHYGKYKYYTLSDSGIKYGRLLRQQQEKLQSNDIVKSVEKLLNASASKATTDDLKRIVSKWLNEKGFLAISQNDTFNYYHESFDKSKRIAKISVSELLESKEPDGTTEKNIIGTNLYNTAGAFKSVKHSNYESPHSVINNRFTYSK